MRRAKFLRAQFRADTRREAVELARSWAAAEPGLELVQIREAYHVYPDGPTWTGLWAVRMEVRYVNRAQAVLGL